MLSMKHDQLKEAMKPIVCIWLRKYRSQHKLTQEQEFLADIKAEIEKVR